MGDDRLRLASTFNSAADLYHRARPDYPEQLFDALVKETELRPDDHLLDVGCATGKALLPLAERGFRITGLDIGADLVAAARRNVARFPHVSIVEAAFENWSPPDTRAVRPRLRRHRLALDGSCSSVSTSPGPAPA
jgi:SAM-dependent methyltransferase